jgi:hypothetical protein
LKSLYASHTKILTGSLPASGLHDGVPDGRFGATNSRLGMSLMGRMQPAKLFPR